MTARFASFSVAGEHYFGSVTDNGIIDLSSRYGHKYRTLQAVIEAGALAELAAEAAKHSSDYALADIKFDIPILTPEKLICVGVNFPDRNEEYKDGQEAPKNMSLFIRFPRSFVGHEEALVRPPESPQLDYEGEIVIVIGKGGRRIPVALKDHILARAAEIRATLEAVA